MTEHANDIIVLEDLELGVAGGLWLQVKQVAKLAGSVCLQD